MENILIDLSNYDKKVYSGADFGRQVRAETGLNHIDLDIIGEVHILVPEKTFAITNSFIRGFLNPTLDKLNSFHSFNQKIKFISTQENKKVKQDIADELRDNIKDFFRRKYL